MALPMLSPRYRRFLGLTLETVSRALSTLHGEGILWLISTPQRQSVCFATGRELARARPLRRSCVQAAPPPGGMIRTVLRSTSKITAVDQPNSSTPFIAVSGPSSRQRVAGTMSP